MARDAPRHAWRRRCRAFSRYQMRSYSSSLFSATPIPLFFCAGITVTRPRPRYAAPCGDRPYHREQNRKTQETRRPQEARRAMPPPHHFFDYFPADTIRRFDHFSFARLFRHFQAPTVLSFIFDDINARRRLLMSIREARRAGRRCRAA